MAKRLFDVALALSGLIAAAPLLLAAALGIWLTSPGRVLFRTRRIGKDGRPFVLLKLRTMHTSSGQRIGPITSANDPRVFGFGKLLRVLKIDELPQLVNVLRGDMSLVGPRPEDPDIVQRFYTDRQKQTLSVRPGLVGIGSLFNYTHGEQLLTGPDAQLAYVQNVLPAKLALEQVYLQRASLVYDIRLILRALAVILLTALGKRHFRFPPEWGDAMSQGDA